MIKCKRENKHSEKFGNTRGQDCHAKGSRKEVKYETLCVGTANMEYEKHY